MPGVTPSSSDRAAAMSEFGAATDTSDVAARARALRLVAENSTLVQQELQEEVQERCAAEERIKSFVAN